MKEKGLLTVGAASAIVFALLVILLPVSADASVDSSWRTNAHGRSIDIDILDALQTFLDRKES